ncbi:MAG: Sensor histidine kinase RcsC [Myxococcota bacterium]|nr:Sensor histidine kinase RcsC [Myxococcota bacterium]
MDRQLQTVLVADDDPDVRLLFGDVLTRERMEVVYAPGGGEALQAIQERQPDLALLDVQMPGLDGLEIVRQVRGFNLDIALVVLTGHNDRETMLTAMNAGADDFFDKALPVSSLPERLRAVWISKQAHNRLRRDAERSLRESEQRYRMLLENVDDGIFLLQDGVIHFVNKRLAEMLSRTAEEIIGRHHTEYIAPEMRELISERHQRRMRGEDEPTVYTTRLMDVRGGVHEMLVRVGVIELQGKLAVLGTCTDITAKLEEEKREARRVERITAMNRLLQQVMASDGLQNLLDAVTRGITSELGTGWAGVWLKDDGTYKLLSHAGSPASDIPVDPEFAPAMVRHYEPLARALAEKVHRVAQPAGPGQGVFAVFPLIRSGQAMGFVLTWHAEAPGEYDTGQLASLCFQLSTLIENMKLAEDLRASYAELKSAQDELIKAGKMAALGEMSAIVAHEVRNPLAVIFNSLGPLNRILKPQGDAEMLLRIINEEATRLNRLVTDLLDFARPLAAQRRQILAQDLLGRTSEAIRNIPRNGGGQRLEIQNYYAENAAVYVDAHFIQQALINLILNAFSASPPDGKVILRAEPAVVGGYDYMILTVSDQGAGMTPEVRARAFEPFFTTNALGTGLGLSLVRKIVEAHDGSIELESEPGKGATFRLRLPSGETLPRDVRPVSGKYASLPRPSISSPG